ncbi:DUF805 domain-containing protein [Stagnihabitans tardus]|uniref:DUF805 domain-containing protein n=1 Tax=Stagnihabitans tardus TaxID=2699202 RepID=A0AAE4YEA4_9RHOB|nr:DUF805 domain-containing protein [Stagnihabitans tardus]NBZ89738.1 DUF805 domain-containing protein [Stagnihabitans tardus]
MTFTESVKAVYSASIFPGRAARSEFWWFALFQFLVAIVIYAVMGAVMGLTMTPEVMMAGGPSGGAFAFVFIAMLVIYAFSTLNMIPSLAVAARRLHDRDMSALWLFLGFVPFVGALALLVIFCLPGTPGPNRFGPDPKSGVNVF